MIPKQILDKLEKLIALRDNAGSPAEAENAAMRIQEILMKHNLDEAQIDAGIKAKNISIVGIKIPIDEVSNKKEGRWYLSLFDAIAKNNLCQIIRTTYRSKGSGIITVIGKEVNVEIVIYTVNNLAEKIRQAAKIVYKQSEGTINFNPNPNAFKRAFYMGCARGIALKLEEQTKDLIIENPGIRGLIKVNEADIDTFINKEFSNVKTAKSVNYRDKSAYRTGVVTGRGMGVSKGIDPGDSQKLLG